MKHESFPRIDVGCSRDGDRAEVSLICELRQGTEPWAMVRLDDISQTGFRVALLPHCKPEKPVRIRIPGLAMLTAKVVRQEGKAVGCAFAEPLHVAVFEHIVSQAALAR
ncbi:MAG: pilus assembly protein PilZ [Novosphingobium sp.]|nr:pilus assembly protein PilZ [Novosphingobium sp.]